MNYRLSLSSAYISKYQEHQDPDPSYLILLRSLAKAPCCVYFITDVHCMDLRRSSNTSWSLFPSKQTVPASLLTLILIICFSCCHKTS